MKADEIALLLRDGQTYFAHAHYMSTHRMTPGEEMSVQLNMITLFFDARRNE
jgi:hypothetical protein